MTEEGPTPPSHNSVAGITGTETGGQADFGGASSVQAGGSKADSALGGAVPSGAATEAGGADSGGRGNTGIVRATDGVPRVTVASDAEVSEALTKYVKCACSQ